MKKDKKENYGLCGEDYVSNSSLSAFRSCPQRFDYSYRQFITPKLTSINLYLGQVIHKALEYYYSEGKKDSQLSLEYFIQAFDGGLPSVALKYTKDLATPEEARDMGYKMLEVYFYDTNFDDASWEVIATELDLKVEIEGLQYVAIIDMIVKNKHTGELGIVDHKTAAKKPDEDYLQWDNQMTGYIWAARQSGYDVKWGMYNYLFKYKKPLWARYTVTRTDEQIADFLYELKQGLAGIKTGVVYKNLSSECPRRCTFWGKCSGQYPEQYISTKPQSEGEEDGE